MGTALNSLMSKKVSVDKLTEASADTLSPEQLASLEQRVEQYRQNALAGERHTKDQMKEIVALFRARRGKAFEGTARKKQAAKKRGGVSKVQKKQEEKLKQAKRADNLLSNL